MLAFIPGKPAGNKRHPSIMFYIVASVGHVQAINKFTNQMFAANVRLNVLYNIFLYDAPSHFQVMPLATFQKRRSNLVGVWRPPSVHSFTLKFKAKVTIQTLAASVEMSLL